MARIDNKGMVRGTVGPVVYRTYRNKNIIQGKPRAFKQSKKSIKASTEFGLSSSAAAVIRRAFEPAYIHRDGAAGSRSTQLVYRCIRNSANTLVGQRDLHDGHLEELVGMNFNDDSKLSSAIQVSHVVKKLEDGTVQVTLGAFNSLTSIKRPAGLIDRGYKCRIRFMLVAFNFREEYIEYLDVQDIDFYKHMDIPEQTVRLKGSSDDGCIQLLSMSLMLYDQMGHTGEYVLLNNRSFSPCAIIAAFQSEKPAPRIAQALDICADTCGNRIEQLAPMGYAGNELLRELDRRIRRQASKKAEKLTTTEDFQTVHNKKTEPELRKRMSFKTF